MIPRPISLFLLLSILCTMLNAQYWEGDLLLGPSSYEYVSNLQNELDNDISSPGSPSAPGSPGGPTGPTGRGGPSNPSDAIGRLSVFINPSAWQTFGSANVGQTILGIGTSFSQEDALENTYFAPSDESIYPLSFKEKTGSVMIERYDPLNVISVNGFIKFSSSETGLEIIENFSLGPLGAISITIPITPNETFDHFSLHFNQDSIASPISLLQVLISDDPTPPYGYREGLKILDCNPDAQGPIIIPTNVTEIGPNAFTDCNEITTIIIGDRDETVKREEFLVHGGAFYNAEKLNAVFIDEGVELDSAEPYLERHAISPFLASSRDAGHFIYGDYVNYSGNSPRLFFRSDSQIKFSQNDNNNNVRIIPKTTFIDDNFSYALNNRNNYTLVNCLYEPSGTIDIPSEVNGFTVDEIGPSAFYQKKLIYSVNFPRSILYIKDNAFSGCINLQNIQFNDGLERISEHAFSHCNALSKVVIPSTVLELNELAFAECSSLLDVKFLGDNNYSDGPTSWRDPFKNSFPTFYVFSRAKGWVGNVRIGGRSVKDKLQYLPSVTLNQTYGIKSGSDLTLSALSYDLFKDYDGDGHLDVDEDINGNGNLDPGEDIDADGKLDQSEPLTETVNGYQWYYGVFPIAQSLGGNDENFTILGEEQQEGFWKLELLQDGTVISSHEFYISVYNDTDSDGLHDAVETGTGVYFSADDTGTDPNNSDSDGDTLADGDEILIHQTDPNNADSDGDTLTDGDEILIHQTDPNNTDSDGDTILDHTEIMNGTNPNLVDTDSDGLDDAQEISYGTDPNLADTSGDGLSDGIIVNAGFDPTVDYSNLLNQRPTQASYDAVVAERDAKLTIDEIQDLRPGSSIIEVSGNHATVQLQMEESSDLQTWEDTGTPATMTIPADTDTKFFRFKMAE